MATNLVTGLVGKPVKVHAAFGYGRRGEIATVYLAKGRHGGKVVPHYTVKVEPKEDGGRSELWELEAGEIELV